MKTSKTAAAGLSVASNSILIATKLLVGLLSGSVAIISEAVHSAVDLLAALLAFFSVRASDRPADREHPFGHGKIENLSGTIEAVLIFAAAIFVLVEAVRKILKPEPLEHIWLGIGLMAFSALANTIVSSWLFRVAKEHDSVALEADAQHLRVDVWTSGSVLVGLLLIAVLTPLVGGKAAYIDPLIAIAVAAQIIRVSWKLTREAGGPLLDRGLPVDEIRMVKDILLDDERVVGYHKLRTRKSGPVRHIDVHLIVPEELSLSEAHDLAEKVEDRIRNQFGSAHVITHVEPGTEENLGEEDTTCREQDCRPRRPDKQ